MTDTRFFAEAIDPPPARKLAGVPTLIHSSILSLRGLTFIMMLTIAILPIAVFYNWAGRSALEHELKRVDENHLIIAKNLSSTLSRYAADSIAVFDSAISDTVDEKSYAKLLYKFDICKVMIFGTGGQRLSMISSGKMHDQDLPTTETIAELRQFAATKPGQTLVSGIRQTPNGAHFYIVKLLPDGRLAIAPWSYEYLARLQKSIAFGELGHSMMVDQNGLVIAHPNPEWERINKNASKLPVVQAMLAGETGVMQFYSPPMDADMIAGYTFVPETGWGVMVPQPIRELEARAAVVQRTALYISLLGIALAVLVGLWFSKVLTAPITALAVSARRIANGDLSTRVDALPSHTPSEIRTLSKSFDDMAEDIELKNRLLNEQLQIEKQLSAERAVLLAESQRSNAMKSQFVSTISHELRTPLTSIRGSVDLVLSGRLGEISPKIENMLGVGKRNTDRLLSLVNDILDFSILEAGQLALNKERVSASQILQDALEMNAPYAGSSKLKLLAHPIPDAFDVMVDQRRIQQVLSNLISNAIKFSGKGEVVELSARIKDGYGVFSVKDHGNGISKEYWPRLFERFTQEDSADTRQAGGTGLGLAISKGIVENHDGTLDFATQMGTGTTFSFKIPLAA
ncbi:MAG: signal transduction histidine kinase [Sulfitobacter sp.]|jgi:signal transduction histidine kinase